MKKILLNTIILAAGFAMQPAIAANPNSWRKVALMIAQRERAVGFSIGNFGYIGMGADTAGGVMKDLWQYDPILDLYTQKADLPSVGRRDASCFVISNKAYVGLGIDTAIFDAARVRRDFYRYDPQTNNWTPVKDMLNEIFFATSFAINGKGYVVCGKTGQANYTDNVYEYDPVLDDWSKVSDFPGGTRYGLCSFVIGNKAYIGTGGDDNLYNHDLWEFSPGNNYSWMQKADFPAAGRTGAGAFTIGNYGFVTCGTDGGYKKDLWEYDPATDTWASRSGISGDIRRSVVTFTIGNKGYMGTGKSDEGPKRDLWEYTMIHAGLGDTYASSLSCTVAPNPVAGISKVTVSGCDPLQESELQIHTMSGALVKKETFKGASVEIDRSELASGVYYVSVSNGVKTAVTKLTVL